MLSRRNSSQSGAKVPSAAPETGPISDRDSHRIRWERDPVDSRRLLILDALTGKVIAIVRSLFDIRPT